MPASVRMTQGEPKETFFKFPPEAAEDYARMQAADPCWPPGAPPLPDFLTIDYPFDVPPRQMTFAKFALTDAGAWRRCPQRACRRSRTCRGGEGPPCFRADRTPLHHVMLLTFLAAYQMLSAEEIEHALTVNDNPYTVMKELRARTPAERRPAPRKRRRRRA
jgi:hypothetical protein